jgi:hypothetical protein
MGEISHLVEHSMNLRHYVLPVHDNRCPFQGAKSEMQDSAPLGDVDLLAKEHRIPPLLDASLSGELQQQSDGFVGNAVFGEIQIQARAFRSKALTAVGILRKELP